LAGSSGRSASACGPSLSASGWPASRAPRDGSPISPALHSLLPGWPRSRSGGRPGWSRPTLTPPAPVRARALADGKLLYIAVPSLADERPFILLDPARLDVPPRRAASITGSAHAGRRIGVGELQPVDLVVCGSVAVNREGPRVGKGGGFSDLEFALLVEAGLIGTETVVVTTVPPAAACGGAAGDRPRLPPRPDRPVRRSSAAAAPDGPRGSSGSTWMRPRSPPSPPWPPGHGRTERCSHDLPLCHGAIPARMTSGGSRRREPSDHPWRGSTRRGKPIVSPRFVFLTAGLVGVG
jgi:5-formyltetrahydrofolate cyclo-ligase family